jgi:hypothetical protein
VGSNYFYILKEVFQTIAAYIENPAAQARSQGNVRIFCDNDRRWVRKFDLRSFKWKWFDPIMGLDDTKPPACPIQDVLAG